jgi:hypothetical protein
MEGVDEVAALGAARRLTWCRLASRGRSRGAIPARWGEAALAVGGELGVGGIEIFAIPELAGDLTVSLVEGLAVVGIEAEANFVATAAGNFAEPIRVGERLPGEADDVGSAVGQDGFGLLEVVDAARCYDWRV